MDLIGKYCISEIIKKVKTKLCVTYFRVDFHSIQLY
jgi:hypothetical protein